MELNYNNPEEILKIKVYNYIDEQDESSFYLRSSNSSSNKEITEGGIIGGIIDLFIIAFIICCYCNKGRIGPTNIPISNYSTKNGRMTKKVTLEYKITKI